MRTFIVNTKNADVIGDEPIWFGGKVVGWVTSGGYAHNAGVSVAMGYIPNELSNKIDGWSIEILGDKCIATLQKEALFDPNGKIIRG